MYPGAPLPTDRVALIRLAGEGLQRGVTVNVDTKPFDFFHRTFEVLPGNHEVTVSLVIGSRESRWPFDLNAEAGHVYEISVGGRSKHSVSFMVDEFSYVFRIVDMTSGSIVQEAQVRI